MPNRKLYYDVSELLSRGLATGIQRVVRKIAANGEQVSGEFGFVMIPVVAIGSRFHALNERGRTVLFGDPVVSDNAFTTGDATTARLAKRIVARVPALYDFLQRLYSRHYVIVRLKEFHKVEPVVFGSGDCLVLLDSFWGGSSAVDGAEAAAAIGCAVVPVIYDMIPVTHPQFCGARLPDVFRAVVDRVFAVCTGIVSISAASVHDIHAYTAPNGRHVPASHFYLGADIVREGGHGHENARGAWPAGLTAGEASTYIMVGTIEPRKGHAVVLEAFERLWAAGRDDRLLIVGKIGWSVDALMQRCAAHPELGRRLFIVHNASDVMLAEAYGFVRAAIIASEIEGFGLPLVEALHKGLPVIASDIPVFREIAGEAALYFAVGDASSLADTVLAMDGAITTYRQAARAFRWIEWPDSARQFLTALKTVIADA